MKAHARICLLFWAFVFSPLAPLIAQTPPPQMPVYGGYPENYQAIVTAWLSANLVDPTGVKLKWLSEPKPGELPIGDGKKAAGYLLQFSINARNSFGTYTGAQKHTALIRDGKVITATGFLYH
jgi:hypothetical protein